MVSKAAVVSGLSIVIPAFNESGRIGSTLQAIASYLDHSGHDAEILVVDDGSQDDTATVATAVLSRSGIPYQVLSGRPNRGKGYSVREGALAATKEWTLVSDADLSTPIAEVEKLLQAAAANQYQVVAGSRGLPQSQIGIKQSWLRMNMGRSFNLLVRLITGLPFRDTQCGFKLWRTGPVRPLLERLRIDGFAWDVELLVAAARAGLATGEVPVEWNNAAGSKVGLINDPLRMFGDLFRIRLRR